jgi:sortase A
MALYRYLKKPPPEKIVLEVQVPKRGISLSFAALFSLAGIFMITSVIWPVLQWSLFYLPKQPAEKFVSPVPKFASPVLAQNSLEYTDWMPKNQKIISQKINYFISIPKLKITKALVEYGGTDLKEYLIGWADSPLPGRPGNNIVFGHSALPTFYDARNYHTIFTYLPSLKKGDEILVDYDGVAYKYEIFDLQTVDPEDFSILEQRFDDSYLTLVTCVPPGTYWKRLMVRARVTKF